MGKIQCRFFKLKFFNIIICFTIFHLNTTFGCLPVLQFKSKTSCRAASHFMLTLNLITTLTQIYLKIFKSAYIWVEHKPSILPAFHDVSVFV